MIALAGTIGTGLFLSSGKAIVRGGPLGAFLGYLFTGILVTGPVLSIAELSALVPLSGGIIRHAEYFVDPAVAFANGWNQVYANMVSIPAEVTAAAVIVDFWSNVNNGVWITVFGLLVLASNVLLVRIYGELEFSFATLKVRRLVPSSTTTILTQITDPARSRHEPHGTHFSLRWRSKRRRVSRRSSQHHRTRD